MARVFVDNEINPDPLGEFMIEYLHGNRNENSRVDYKLTVDISRQSDFAKIAKHIFAMSNNGGGWLLFGYEDIGKGKIIPRGLDERFNVDQASLQEKFNSYCSEHIKVPFRTYEKMVEDEDGTLEKRLFAALFVPPSSEFLVPVKDGYYIEDSSGKRKTVFEKEKILTRRESQSVEANAIEIAEIKERIHEEHHRLSMLDGKVDHVKETVFGNLLEVTKIPDHIYKVKLAGTDFPFSMTGQRPFYITGNYAYSFCSFHLHPFNAFVEGKTQSKRKSTDYIGSSDENILIVLLNLEAISAMRKRHLQYDRKSRCLYFPTDADERYESWGIPGMGRPRCVSRKRWVKKIGRYRWRHYAVKLSFEIIGPKVYLKVEPNIILTTDGRRPVHNPEEGTLITPLIRRRFNRTHYLDLHYWASLIPRRQDGSDIMSLGERVEVSPNYVCAFMEKGIAHDRPMKEQKHGPAWDALKKEGRFILPSSYIDEPALVFGGRKEDTDPRLGLKYYGPFHTEDERPKSQMRVGIIATGNTLSLAKTFLEMLKTEQETHDWNKFLSPSYPGFSSTSVIGCEILISDSWQEVIRQRDIDLIVQDGLKNPDSHVNERIAKAVKLYVEKVRNISMEDSRPDLILCIIPKKINDYCGITEKTRKAKRRRKDGERNQTLLTEFGVEDPNPRSFDLRNAVKGQIMEYGIPIQFLQEEKATAVLDYKKPSRIQEPATFSWNIGTAMYYKSDGKPWRLAKLEKGTCYVGVSFYRSYLKPKEDLHVSMAQVFTHSGDGFVLKGSEVEIDESTKEPSLNENSAFQLLEKAIAGYSSKVYTKPSRVVIHKSSRFKSGERKGFLDAIGGAKADLVAIRPESSIQFVRTGRYPMLRGTLIRLAEKRFLLFTSGYIPRLRTYPGPRIPRPLNLEIDADSEPEQVATEVLKLTKINWNTAAFCDKKPITLEFPRRVGQVLSELPDGAKIQSHYRFYM
ncbi:MAG: RNA-binding domain-containing protein [Candidatus Thorarchaeota archaeon]